MKCGRAQYTIHTKNEMWFEQGCSSGGRGIRFKRNFGTFDTRRVYHVTGDDEPRASLRDAEWPKTAGILRAK